MECMPTIINHCLNQKYTYGLTYTNEPTIAQHNVPAPIVCISIGCLFRELVGLLSDSVKIYCSAYRQG